jgi:uncharacterized protein (TIGR03435 family)
MRYENNKAAMKIRNSAWPMASVLLLLPAVRSQQIPAAPAQPQFEVASLKPNNGCENTPRSPAPFSPSPGLLQMQCMTLQGLIQTAFGTFRDGVTIDPQPLRMEGGPSWMRSEHYSVSAKAESPARTEMLAGPMLRALLEERFQLKTHREMRETPVYAMTIGKGGLKTRPLAEGACAPLDMRNPPPFPKPGDPTPNVCGVLTIRPTSNGDVTIEVRGATMPQFAQRLSQFVDRTVVDRSGIPDKFNFKLEFTPDPNMPGQRSFAGRGGDPGNLTPPPDARPDLFVALQEQIGLKLSSDKGPVSFLIIDYVEKPTSN